MGTNAVGMGDKIKMAEGIKYSVIVVSSVPILMVYPFVQKHFVKGVMIGAVKG
jgi:putative aldouronate transport system permease protein